ncbi:hypothetical protein AAFP35_23970 [Gordonia sp. CPCC 206044]|uniref:hypothetical protein n=1 Tax=Gordonia sp. CPCC 206044 TaxID=3140793 RepID=UPI003AF40711
MARSATVFAAREELTPPSEAARARKRRARVLAPKAAEKKGGRPKKGEGKTGEKLAPVSSRKTRDVAAKGTGYSGPTLDKVDAVVEAAASESAPEPVRTAAREAATEM